VDVGHREVVREPFAISDPERRQRPTRTAANTARQAVRPYGVSTRVVEDLRESVTARTAIATVSFASGRGTFVDTVSVVVDKRTLDPAAGAAG
jgi:hypothetical protein